MNDRLNVPFTTLRNLFDLALLVNRSKIRKIVLTFWSDDSAQDALCTYTFVTSTGASRTGNEGGGNHLLTLTLQPELDPQQYVKIHMGN